METTTTGNQAKAQGERKINWGKPLFIPPAKGKPIQYGLAGSVTGTSHDHLVVAGGANFEDMVPWMGGTKLYHDVVYLMKANHPGKGIWTEATTRLPMKMGYAACVSWNNRIIALGGETAHGPIANVMSLQLEGNDICCQPLTALPLPVTSGGAAVIGNRVYLAGGCGPTGGLTNLLSARLDQTPVTWEELAPLPLALSHAVVASQHDGTESCLFVIGGRNKTGIVSDFYSTIWKYSPSKDSWEKAGELTNEKGKTVALSAGTGVAFGDHHIVLFGGDPGIVFNRTERFLNAIAKTTDEEEKKKLVSQKNQGQESHPGFMREVMVYNTITKQWRNGGRTPFESQVTTHAVTYGNTVFIPSGEIKPGIRTAMVSKATIK